MQQPIVIMSLIIFGLSGCVAPASKEDAPNVLHRSRVLSANSGSITIKHNLKGQPISFETAKSHCEKFDKIAIYQGASKKPINLISTWVCQLPPEEQLTSG